MKTLSFFFLLFLFMSCSNSLLTYPNLERAFLQETFLEKKQQTPKRKSYSYITSRAYVTVKNDFEEFLGPEWAKINNSESYNEKMKEMLKGNRYTSNLKVRGSSLYYNRDFSDIKLLLVYLEINSKHSGIVVIEEKGS